LVIKIRCMELERRASREYLARHQFATQEKRKNADYEK